LEHDSGPKVIFVHLMGQHVPYARRYPPEFARFDGPLPVAGFGGRERSRQIGEMVNTYDNATLYVDHVLHRMLEIVQRRTTSATMLYFSDHGEAPLEGLPRADSRFHPDHVEIPFLLWFSKGFAERHPELVRIAKANRDKRFMLDELEDTVLDLVGIETPYLEPKRSLLRATYTEPTRLLFNGKLDYDRYDDPLLTAWRNMRTVAEIRPALHDRIWAHRVDTLGKLSDIADLFAGAELDLVFDQATGLLEVRDPPTPHYGLTLEHVLDAQRARQGRLNLWLDIKEMDSDNAARILARLAELDRHHILKDRVIVETTFKGAGVKRFAKSGFYTSHQLSTDEVQAALQDPGRLSELATETCEVVKSSGFAAISFDMIVYPFVRDYLAPCAAEQDLDYLVRDLALSSSRPEFADAACRWELDERIKVVLVPVASRYDI
jgi:Sulfatase